MAALFAGGGALHAFEVEDRYSSYGLTGVAVTRGAVIEQFVMSCRIVGMEVEISMLAEVCRTLRAAGRRSVEALAARRTPTCFPATSSPARDSRARDDQWVLSLESEIAAPAHTELSR